MSVIKDAIAESLASVERIVPIPAEPFNYGRDLVCRYDLRGDMGETDPNSPEGIMLHNWRFITTDRDSVPDAPGRGFNIFRLVNRGTTERELREAEGAIRAEFDADDRIERTDVSMQLEASGVPQIKGLIKVTPEAVETGDFTYTFAVDAEGGVFLERLS